MMTRLAFTQPSLKNLWHTIRIWSEKFSLHIHIAALQFASDWNVIWHSDFISFRHDHLVILLPYWEGGLAVGIRGLQYKLNNRQMGEEYRSCGVNKSSIIPLFNIQIFILMNLQQILALFALKLGVPLRNPTILNIIRWDDGSTKRLSNVHFDNWENSVRQLVADLVLGHIKLLTSLNMSKL